MMKVSPLALARAVVATLENLPDMRVDPDELQHPVDAYYMVDGVTQTLAGAFTAGADVPEV